MDIEKYLKKEKLEKSVCRDRLKTGAVGARA